MAELRDIQSIDNALLEDRVVIKNAAFNAKRINRKANTGGISKKEEITRKIKELEEQKKHMAELKEVAERQATEKIRLKQQIKGQLAQLATKKKRDLADELANRYVMSDTDRNVACKSAFKSELLEDALHIKFIEKRTFDRVTVKGVVSAPDDLHPFEKRLLGDADNELAFTLWNEIKKPSKNMHIWDALISDTIDTSTDNETI